MKIFKLQIDYVIHLADQKSVAPEEWQDIFHVPIPDDRKFDFEELSRSVEQYLIKWFGSCESLKVD